MAGPAPAARSGRYHGSRLKPVVDSLETVGFVSKGDRKLLEHIAQKDYFESIKQRYMDFCARHSNNLTNAFASLPTNASADATRNPPASRSQVSSKPTGQTGPSPAAELSTLLLSLRKLREAVLATASKVPVSFQQQVHVFSIKLSIRAKHPPSYFPSLRYILETLHSTSHPLPESELRDIISYLILDYACRQGDMTAAFELRAHSRIQYAFQSDDVDRVLAALTHDNWIVFWRVRQQVDSAMRAVMDWAEDRVRRHALKAVGSAYLNVHVDWIVEGCTGDKKQWTWEHLVDKEGLGWQLEGDKVIIRKPKPRVAPPKG
ncbi:uncharacterized protein ACLA_038470 [Aspergillus clavatus NRRL 1]|uniref:SAC3/GANP domain protein n=1 Tax=Aspergillus clavatus (strain ATCC 1007 / CBS 513.65 / DSM 816 / NCTC 3887 / NRRL 1 / QM 1276 / 107) TaxID=344612 RepID=A1CKG2_ASPCL|nr:uncharacterized protein ACLA_038470 [Aspergillus clavatus NRRL 1]EAW09636.1 conserved hypothetical protein [Aspergillus clavatus NRRL 1]